MKNDQAATLSSVIPSSWFSSSVTLMPSLNSAPSSTSGEMTPTVGSRALLLQMATNLLQNAIIHNLPDHGTVWVTTSVQPHSVVLTVENTGEKLNAQVVATLPEPFQRGN